MIIQATNRSTSKPIITPTIIDTTELRNLSRMVAAKAQINKMNKKSKKSITLHISSFSLSLFLSLCCFSKTFAWGCYIILSLYKGQVILDTKQRKTKFWYHEFIININFSNFHPSKLNTQTLTCKLGIQLSKDI